MNEDSQDPILMSLSGDPPDWLLNLLRAARHQDVPEGFRQRCRQSAGAALTLARLRRERERIGFVPLSLPDYVEGMARALGESLSEVLAWLGLRELRGEDAAAPLARLGHALGMSWRETLAHLRIAFTR